MSRERLGTAATVLPNRSAAQSSLHTTKSPTLPAFAGYGIELEYAIVDRESLDVRPIADRLLRAMAGRDTSDVTRGELGWSNELVLHVVELKNRAPTHSLERLPALFGEEIRYANRVLESMSCRLMPTGAHPWMNPRAETLLWPREGTRIYSTYDRLFNCRSHGWANLQSMHINLPFADDDQFARLHAAIRLVLPLLPALSASSPIIEGRPAGFMDYRLEAYRINQQCMPSINGLVVPDTVDSRERYEQVVLAPMYREIAPHDPEGVLQHEWLNSRGAIARFDRNAIEIRLADTQECPLADVAIAAATSSVVRSLYRGELSALAIQEAVPTDTLHRVLLSVIREAEEAVIDDAELLAALDIRRRRAKAGEIWRDLLENSRRTASNGDLWWHEPIAFILEHGSLARRIARAVGGAHYAGRIRTVYETLCQCLDEGRMFD